ncbi:CAP domain-containing protein [Halobacillus sp. BAB-2008]|uniref:CAP domain-containing protein n=1 Tax=Halobacillus sp. BAB-2008 TaxID=1246484 RepID=UPI0002A5229F|nr:CAP domain-containing protein [Halobacillus sp. BAB-2008]ELK46359.1 hypothetical protein D479_11066 [Halobacillus sp. BAB-2008]
MRKLLLFLIALLVIIVVATPVSAQDIWKWKDNPKESYEKVTRHIQGLVEGTDVKQEVQTFGEDLRSFFDGIEWKYVEDSELEQPQAENNGVEEQAEPAAEEGSIDDYQPNEFEKEVVALVNEEREQRGLAPLKIDNRLSGMAKVKSQDLSDKDYFSHESPTYGSPFDMMNQFDFDYRAAGENIAAGQRTPEQVVEGWMNSDGHRANILHKDFTHIGVGYVKGDGRYTTYWTQLFMTPK